MSLTSNILTAAQEENGPPPENITRIAYHVNLKRQDSIVCIGSFPHASARRDHVLAYLAQTYPNTKIESKIEELLTPLGGANADYALRKILAYYIERFDLDYHLSLVESVEVLPNERIFAYSLTKGGETQPYTTVITASAVERLRRLRSDATHAPLNGEGLRLFEQDVVDAADEAQLSDILDTQSNIHTHLYDLARDADGSYTAL